MNIEKYISKLVRLVELERETEIEVMREEMKSLSGKEREKLGRAILDLKGKIIGREFNFKLVKYSRKRPIKTDIKVGDLAVISKKEPFLSNLVATLVEKGERYIILALDSVPEWALKKVRVDLAADDITYKRQLENLYSLTNYGKRILKFLLKKEKPKKSRFLNFNSENKRLNKDQKEAVGFSLGSKDFFLIHGPFGTGKTTTLVELILQEIKRRNKILVTAESNVAIDNIVECLYKKAKIVRVGHPSRVSKKLKQTTLSFLVQKHPAYKNVLRLREEAERISREKENFLKPTQSRKRGLRKRQIMKLAMRKRGARGIPADKIRKMAQWLALDKELQKVNRAIKALQDQMIKKIIKESEVILSTNSSSASEFLEGMKFDVVIVDEASQATTPSCLIPLSRAKKFILAGDHKQLPPTILNLKASKLAETLFEKLILNFPQKSKMLKIQYRMNEILMEFPSWQFYHGRIISSKKVRQISLSDFEIKTSNFNDFFNFILNPKKPLVFVDTREKKEKWEFQKEGSSSRENHLEADLVVKILKKLLKIGIEKDWMGVITPYEDQVKLIKDLLKDEDIEVKTVDGYQGREKEVIIISFVRSNKEGNLGFLEDLRRLNVSLTRAKRKLIAIGDSETLEKNKIYKEFIEFSKKKGRYINAKKI
jgi:predicted DNA helicase